MAERPTRWLQALLPMALLGCGEPTAGALPELSASLVPSETSTNYALSFEGGQYATTATADFPVAKTDQSISVWLKPGGDTADQAVFTTRRGAESGTILGFSAGRVTVWSVWGMRLFVEAPEPLPTESWSHIAYVQVGVDEEYQQRLFIDGELVAEGTLAPQSRTPTASWVGSDGRGMYYVGAMDGLRFYARPLGEAEIEAEAQGQALPSDASLVADWSFNERPEEAVIYDRSGHGNHGTLGDGVRQLMPERIVFD